MVPMDARARGQVLGSGNIFGSLGKSSRCNGCVTRSAKNQSSADPPFPSFVFTLAATGTTLSISMFSSAE